MHRTRPSSAVFSFPPAPLARCQARHGRGARRRRSLVDACPSSASAGGIRTSPATPTHSRCHSPCPLLSSRELVSPPLSGSPHPSAAAAALAVVFAAIVALSGLGWVVHEQRRASSYGFLLRRRTLESGWSHIAAPVHFSAFGDPPHRRCLNSARRPALLKPRRPAIVTFNGELG